MDRYRVAAKLADRIEKNLREIHAWRHSPLPEEAWEGRRAFYADTMTFFEWLQFVLVPRIREIVEQHGAFPSHSEVAAQAVRELDGVSSADELIHTLCSLDAFIDHDTSSSAYPVFLTPPELVERYWRTRDAALLDPNPSAAPTFDTYPADRVFATAAAFVRLVGEVEPGLWEAIVEAERGQWLVRTAVSADDLIDLPGSLSATIHHYLSLHSHRPPGTTGDDKRSRAMWFWHCVQNRRLDWARELTLTPFELPLIGEGYVDEYVWGVGEDDAGVQVLINTRDECREQTTHMERRDGKWYVAAI